MSIAELTSKQEGLERKSADEIVAELTQSAERSEAGFTKSAHSVSSKMKEKYAV